MRVDGWKQGKRRFSYQGKTLKAFTPAEGAAEKAKVDLHISHRGSLEPARTLCPRLDLRSVEPATAR